MGVPTQKNLKKGDKRWYLDYTDSQGKRRRPCANTLIKREAFAQQAEVEAQVHRKKLGLETTVNFETKGLTVEAAWERWLREWAPSGSVGVEWCRFRANIQGTKFGQTLFAELTPVAVEKWMREKVDAGQSPVYVNGHRRYLRCVYNAFFTRQLAKGTNPASAAPELDELERIYDLLTEEEFQRVCKELPPHWVDVVLIGYYSMLRRGEVYALRKSRTVVDFDRGFVYVRASNLRNVAKGDKGNKKKAKGVALLPEARAALRRAWDKALPGELLFPGHNGEMRGKGQAPAKIIRSAMARAGVIEYWVHKCRTRGGCHQVEEKHADEQYRHCSQCNHLLIPSAVVRKVRFHDLRHSQITNLLNAGVDIHTVSLTARHWDISFTDEHYAHRTEEAVRDALMPKTLEQKLLELEKGASPEEAALLAQTRENLAQNRHSTSATTTLKLVAKC